MGKLTTYDKAEIATMSVVTDESISSEVKLKDLQDLRSKLETWIKCEETIIQRENDEDELDDFEDCPSCGNHTVQGKGIYRGGGVECITEGCNYWFCY